MSGCYEEKSPEREEMRRGEREREKEKSSSVLFILFINDLSGERRREREVSRASGRV